MLRSTVLTLLALSGSAYAAADVNVSIAGPVGGTTVYATGRYNFTVANIGNKSASNVVLTIDLPETNTSPQVYLMGTLIGQSAGCTLAARRITCTLGTIARNTNRVRYVDIQLPESAADLVFEATVTTTSAQNSTANDTATHIAAINYIDVPIAGPWPMTVVNNHCTGTGLVAWFECTYFPSAITDHTVEFHPGALPNEGTITIPGYPTFGGTWSKPSPTELIFQYTDGGIPEADFYGNGVGGGCFEGLTTFPGSAYVAPYEVCL
jgi:hypothetical protein